MTVLLNAFKPTLIEFQQTVTWMLLFVVLAGGFGVLWALFNYAFDRIALMAVKRGE